MPWYLGVRVTAGVWFRTGETHSWIFLCYRFSSRNIVVLIGTLESFRSTLMIQERTKFYLTWCSGISFWHWPCTVYFLYQFIISFTICFTKLNSCADLRPLISLCYHTFFFNWSVYLFAAQRVFVLSRRAADLKLFGKVVLINEVILKSITNNMWLPTSYPHGTTQAHVTFTPCMAQIPPIGFKT